MKKNPLTVAEGKGRENSSPGQREKGLWGGGKSDLRVPSAEKVRKKRRYPLSCRKGIDSGKKAVWGGGSPHSGKGMPRRGEGRGKLFIPGVGEKNASSLTFKEGGS